MASKQDKNSGLLEKEVAVLFKVPTTQCDQKKIAKSR